MQPVIVDTPKVVEEGRTGPVTKTPGDAVPMEHMQEHAVSKLLSPAEIRKLFVEPMGNHLDESLRAEISKQFNNRIQVVTERQDADAILKGLSGARDGRNHPSGFHDNATGSISLYDKTGRTILWSGEANDQGGQLLGSEHGGEARVAQRLVKGLKGYLKTE